MILFYYSTTSELGFIPLEKGRKLFSGHENITCFFLTEKFRFGKNGSTDSYIPFSALSFFRLQDNQEFPSYNVLQKRHMRTYADL